MAPLKVGIIGCGSIGTLIAKAIDMDEDFALSFLMDEDGSKATELSGKLKSKPSVVSSVSAMKGASLVIEAASQECVREHAQTILSKSDIMIMSVGALADPNLLNSIRKAAEEGGKRIYIPSGAIAGLDGIRAVAGSAEKVTLTTRKNPLAFEGVPWIAEKDIALRSIKKPTVIFEGTAAEAAELFPVNINVAMSLSLAGIGPEKTRVKILADPFIKENIHEVEAEGPFGKMLFRTENAVSSENPRTSQLAGLSAVAMLKGIAQSMRVGT
ncbi:MAG: aspartate dehydrogenase [Candidatus Aenigmatarchaeota archaeon]